MPKGIYEHKPLTQEIKKKISLANKGRPHLWQKGRTFSKETKRKISEALKGKKDQNNQLCGK